MSDAGLGHSQLFLTQNDGTLVRYLPCLTCNGLDFVHLLFCSVSRCLSFPVCTFASGPTNSMRGAAYLCKADWAKNAIVVDIGGTTTDVGQLVNGFPREAGTKVEVRQIKKVSEKHNLNVSNPPQIGGIFTNFRMPDLFSFGLGGGSLVKRTGSDSFTVGPLSVGSQLLKGR